MPDTTPPADIQISHDLIDSLLKEFVPELAREPIEFVASGWDNEIHRVGADHAVRLPRRKEGAPLVEYEQRWLPELADHLPLAIPSPTHAGRPAFGFPWHWSVVPWIEGVPHAHAPEVEVDTLIDQLTGFLKALHRPAPSNAPLNPYRGVPLAERRDAVASRIDSLRPIFEEIGLETEPIANVWDELVATPSWTGPPVWLHGDFHPLNIVVYGGEISGVIDFGDITSGDPANDLMVAWMALDSAEQRNKFRQRAAVNGRSIDAHTWNRARAWALAHATATLESSSDAPSMRRMATTTIKNVMAQP